MQAKQQQQDREFSLSDKEFQFLADLANRKTGIMMPEGKRDMVYSRLVRRLRALKLQSFAQYCTLLSSDSGHDEMANLVNSITTNLTHFFREAHHFEHLGQNVIKPLIQKTSLQQGGTKKLRIWSAGCSSGMEAYSIAMVANNMIGSDIKKWNARILATDIDTNMLDRGIIGEYPIDEYANIAPKYHEFVQKYSLPKQGEQRHGEQMQINAELQKLVAFKYLNLLDNFPMTGQFDAIFCRNVVIYFDKNTQKKMFSRMSKYLSPNGFLYIGHSENISTICPEFELVGKTIYKLRR